MTAKQNTAMHARRMLALLPYLRQGETLELAELASAVGATTSQVAGDLTALSFCGVPPFTPDEMIDLAIDGDTVTVLSAPPALERPVRLAPREARALVAALEAAGHAADDPLVTKLLTIASAELDPAQLAATLRAGDASAPVVGIYAVLAEAIETGTKVRIGYFSAGSGTHSERVICPHALANDRGAWYVNAYCESACAMRTFRLDRIREAEATGERFQPSVSIDASVSMPAAGLPIAVLRLAPTAPHTEERDWPGATFSVKPNGAIFAEVPYSSATWVARRVAAGLGMIDAIEPAEVRAAVREVARGALAEL
ncbi:MAG: WYL domain-containing protein [Actinomycetia bacterium]|nr:WYL domain-containing protein [Actinomycetes bacterium]